MVLTEGCKKNLANECVEKLILLRKSENDFEQGLLLCSD